MAALDKTLCLMFGLNDRRLVISQLKVSEKNIPFQTTSTKSLRQEPSELA